MNYNILTYIIFFSIVAFVTIKVGWMFYKNGEHFIHNLIPDDPHLVHSINKTLLVGYYLLNLGYAAVVIKFWTKVHSITELIETIGNHAGMIIIGLGIIHFKNMLWLTLYKKYRNRIINKNLTIKI